MAEGNSWLRQFWYVWDVLIKWWLWICFEMIWYYSIQFCYTVVLLRCTTFSYVSPELVDLLPPWGAVRRLPKLPGDRDDSWHYTYKPSGTVGGKWLGPSCLNVNVGNITWYGGFHSHGGTPKLMVYKGNPIKMDENWGYHFISGNRHVTFCWVFFREKSICQLEEIRGSFAETTSQFRICLK